MPTYETWGETATILFLVLRVIQGVALAGEPTAANLYLFENSSLSRDDPWYTQAPWYCKVMGISEQVGGLFALLIGYIALHFFNDYVHGWRIPFVFCAVFVVFLAFMRKRLTESYDYQVASGNKEINMFAQNELRDFYKKIQFHRSSMVYWILLLLPYPIVFYMCFLQISPKVVSGTEELLLHNTYVSLGSILISLFSAYFPLRYKWNLRITVASCAIMGCLFAFMSIWCLENHYSFYMVYIFQILMMSLINFGLVMPALLKVFQTVGRYTFMTLGWAIARFTNFFLIVIVMKIIEDRFGLYGCLIFLYGIVGLALYAVYAHVSYYNMDIESIKRSIKKARTVEGVTVMSREEINEYMGNKG
jgi:MFS family permease